MAVKSRTQFCESGFFYIIFDNTIFLLLHPSCRLFYKPAVRSSLPCVHNSSGSVGDRIQIIPPSIDEPPSSVDLLPVILACSCLSSLFTFRNILFHQAVQCAFHLYHNVHQPVVLFAKPLVFFFQSIFAMSLHAHCFRPPYASSAAALSCVHFLLLKYIIHFPAIEKWFLNASFDTVRKTPDTHRQASALPPPLLPQSGRLRAIPRLLQKKRQSHLQAGLPLNLLLI